MEAPIHATPTAAEAPATSASAAAPASTTPASYSPAGVWLKTALCAALVTGSLAAVVYVKSGAAPWLLHKPGDSISEHQQQERERVFAALGAIPLAIVSDAELTAAVDSMDLPAAARQALLANLTGGAPGPAAATAEATPALQPGTAQGPAQNPVQSTAPDTSSMQPTNAAQAAPASHAVARKARSLQLAWITLWDTDAEDGDAIRIDSEGYSRTVVLSKEPVTFAIPVPLSGVVDIHGIKDGEGGGITVGLASGASKAIFPIMSVGEVLGLKVKLP